MRHFLRSLLPLLFSFSATTVVAQSHSLCPYLQFGTGQLLPILRSDTKVEIDGIIARVEVTQTYFNAGQTPLEAEYVFPGSTQAAVDGLQLRIGQRRVQAQIQERQSAQQAYQRARQQGQRAALLEQDRPNIFRIHVANILPQDTVRTVLTYTELLIPEEGQYEWVYPTTVGPRYTGEEQTAALSLPVRGTPSWGMPYRAPGQDTGLQMSLDITLRSPSSLQSVESPSHRLQTEWSGERESRIRLHPSDHPANNRDFVLRYRLRGTGIESGLMLYEGEGEDERYFALLVQPPERVPAEQIVPREYLFLLDVSGSMHGQPLQLAQRVISALLRDLRPQDRFNILAFSGGSAWLSPQSLPVNAANVDRALRGIQQLSGGGGTHLLAALQSALAQPQAPEYARSFVILTDGYVSVEAEAFDYLRGHLGAANFFTFGIGKSVNRYLLEGLARAGAGAPFIVLDEAEEAATVERFRRYVEAPLLTQVQCSLPGWTANDFQPSRTLPDLLGERPILLLGKYYGAPGEAIVIRGRQGGKEFCQTIASSEAVRGSEAIARLWARQRIQNLQDDLSVGTPDRETHIAEITQLGLRYSLLTQYTAFLAVDNEVVNPGGQSEWRAQPQEIPAGTGNWGVYSGTFSAEAARSSAYDSALPPPPPPPVAESPEAEEIFRVVEKMPVLQRCAEEVPAEEWQNCTQRSLMAYLKQEIEWPLIASAPLLGGTIVASFTIRKDGSVDDIHIIRSVHPAYDGAFLRALRKMPAWRAGTQNGRPVDVRYYLPIKANVK